MVGGGYKDKFSASEKESIRRFKEIVSEIVEYFKGNLLDYIKSLKVSIEVKYLLMAHTFANDLQSSLIYSTLIVQSLENDTLTLTDILTNTEKALEKLNGLIIATEVFTTEGNLLSYAKILSTSERGERKELAELINVNAKFRKDFTDIAKQYYNYIKRQRDVLQNIKDSFEQRDIKFQMQHSVTAQDL